MKKFLVIMLAMLWMSVAAFSQITISQEDYDKLPNETRTQIEKLTTEKAVKGEIKEVSEYANLGKEIGVAVNETLKAVEDSAIRIADSSLGQKHLLRCLNTFTLDRLLFMVTRIPLVTSWLKLLRT